jgi:hypothetical protein
MGKRTFFSTNAPEYWNFRAGRVKLVPAAELP